MTFQDLTIGLCVKIGDSFSRVHAFEGNVAVLVTTHGSITKMGERMVNLFCCPILESDYDRLFAEEQNVRDNGHEPYTSSQIPVDNSR
jgi:hypothetical protein